MLLRVNVPDDPATHGPMPTDVLRTAELDYTLPRELIATRPAEPRDTARMLVLRRGDESIEHAHVCDLGRYLKPGDALVFNTTAVLPARLVGRKVPSRGRVEGLFLGELQRGRWRTMLSANGRLKLGDRIQLLDPAGRPSEHCLTLVSSQDGTWQVDLPGAATASAVLQEVGQTPLPPYIRRSRGDDSVSDSLDRKWYSTVYADARQRRSVAAPTAGLHFTSALLARIEESGVRRVDVTLDIGPPTFRPITAPTVAEHVMHAEHYTVPAEAVTALAEGRGRTLAVGTTVVRLLESLPAPLPQRSVDDGLLAGETDLMIVPGHRFRHVDGMLTNFHLPRSTLLALVAAMVGLDRIKAVYAEAIRHRYRFYSYGDAMLVLP